MGAILKNPDKPTVNTRVTDFKCLNKTKDLVEGFLMNRMLFHNIRQIPGYVKKDNACIGIISGSNQTRTGKSTLGLQIAYTLSFILAGGKMDDNGKVLERPKEPIKINLFFDIAPLRDAIENAPQNSVFVLDEASDAGGSRSATAKRNKDFNDFIIRSAFKNYILILVLPDFFSLSNNWACAHSLFLANVWKRNETERGYFSFFNRYKKEALYNRGRQLLGAFAKYSSWKPDFTGRFPKTFPFDKETYKQMKLESLNNTLSRKSNNASPAALERDLLVSRMYTNGTLTYAELAVELNKMGLDFDATKVHSSLRRTRNKLLSDEALAVLPQTSGTLVIKDADTDDVDEYEEDNDETIQIEEKEVQE